MNAPEGFYVYAYLRACDSSDGKWLAQTPYYVGKGKGGRAWQAHYPIPRPKDSRNIVILACGLAEAEAHALEKQLIKQFGRADIGTGYLRNFTDGGEGQSGRAMSEATRAKIREALLGKPSTVPLWKRSRPAWNRGKTYPPEERHKFGLNRGKKVMSRASSPYFGVHWLKNKSRWRAYVRLDGKNRPLITSEDPIVCARVYDRYVVENKLGMPLNFPGEPLIEIFARVKKEKVDKTAKCKPETRPYSRRKRSWSSSPYLGVHWTSQQRMWRSCVYINGKTKYLGSSPDPVVVAKKYNAFVIANGLDWPLNFQASDDRSTSAP